MNTLQAITETRHQYSVIVHFHPEDDVYYATIPALDLITQGDSIDEAFWMAEDAIGLWIKTAIEDEIPILVEDHPIQVRQIAV